VEDLNLVSVGLVTGITLAASWAGLRVLSAYEEKIFFTCNMVGLFFYCGIGYGYADVVPSQYIYYYAVFIGVYCSAFILGLWAIPRSARRGTRSEGDANPVWPLVVRSAPLIFGAYLGLIAISLVYPEIVLHRLWAPPFPSVFEWWNEGLGRTLTEWEMVEQSVQALVFPLFLIALFRVRGSMLGTVALIVLPFYLEYCSTGYTGRSTLLAVLALVFVPLWLEYPAYRRRVALILATVSPLVLATMYVWSASREGQLVGIDVPIWQMMVELLAGETSFPTYSEKILEFGQGVDLTQYFLWIVTLPIPRFIMPSKPTVQLNFEIAEVLGGVLPGEAGFTVLLPGPISESVYIFGHGFFWLHALIIGSLAAVAVRVSLDDRRCVFVYAYFLYAFSYVFARAGAGGLMPIMVNQFLSYYILYVYGRYASRLNTDVSPIGDATRGAAGAVPPRDRRGRLASRSGA
jgi:hypothetical protein